MKQAASKIAATAVAYPTSVHWAGGTDHVMTDANDAVDIISMFTITGGTVIYANIVGKAFA